MQSQSFEAWAIVELFGHNKIAGKVSEHSIGGSMMVRMEVPDTEAAPAFTRFLHINAIYAINPVTEEVATAYAARLQVKPVEVWDAREVLKRIDAAKQLAAASKSETPDPDDEEEEEEEDGHLFPERHL